MKDLEKYLRRAEQIFQSAYSDGYTDGFNKAKEKYENHRGITHCHRAKPEEIDRHGIELWGWCDCGKPIEGRWAGFANFCPWCGRVIEWDLEKRKETRENEID